MTKFDIALIVIVCVASIMPLLRSVGVHPTPTIAEVRVSNQVVRTISLDEDKTHSVNGALGRAVFEVRDGKVRMIESACPNKICVRQGWIRTTGRSIICLPNRLVITTKGTDEATTRQNKATQIDSIAR